MANRKNPFPWAKHPHLKKSIACYIARYVKSKGVYSRQVLCSRHRHTIAKGFMEFARQHHGEVYRCPHFTLSKLTQHIAWALTPQPNNYKHASIFYKLEYRILLQLEGVELAK
mgnify:CR=1 FL=1